MGFPYFISETKMPSPSSLAKTESEMSPGYLRIKAVQWAFQFAIAAIALVLIALMVRAISVGLSTRGITFDMSYLWKESQILLSEGRAVVLDENGLSFKKFDPTMTNFQALSLGFYNTLKITLIGIVLATLLGMALAALRISNNFLARTISHALVEFLRSMPILVLIFFAYFAVILNFPPVSGAVQIFGGVFSVRGVSIPWFMADPEAQPWQSWALFLPFVVIVAGIVSKSLRPWRRYILTVSGVILAGVLMFGFAPFQLEMPKPTRFSVVGGAAMSAEFAGLMLALVVNSAAYISEIFRGAMQAIPKGQFEAAAAVGLSHRSTLFDVVFPQVFRVVIPSLSNQYVSFAKNSSLGLAIGFAEMFNIYGTVANQTGRNLETVLVVMAAYLVLSWTIVALASLANSALLRRS